MKWMKYSFDTKEIEVENQLNKKIKKLKIDRGGNMDQILLMKSVNKMELFNK